MEKHRPEDDLFKKILEDHPQFKPADADIKDMRRRLDQAEASPSQNGILGWWLPLLLIPFLLGGFYLFNQNHQLNTKINFLQTQIETTKKDSIQKNFITYRYDTIYNVIYKDKIIERQYYKERLGSFSNVDVSVLKNLDESFRTFAVLPPNVFYDEKQNQTPFKYFTNSSASGNVPFSIIQKFNFYKEKNQNNLDGINPGNIEEYSNTFIPVPSLTEFLKEKELGTPFFEISEAALDHKGYQRSALDHLRPTGFQVGIQGSPFGFSTINAGKPMNSIGLLSEIEFGKQLRLQIGARFTKLKFEEKDPLAQANYPAITPDNPGDVVRELYVTLNDLQIPISFKYLLRKDKKWNPFLSIGMVATKPLRQGFGYEFIDNSLSEYSKSQSFGEGVFSIENFQGAFGMEYEITKNIYAEASVFYMHDFKLDVGEYILLRNAGLNLGLKYKL